MLHLWLLTLNCVSGLPNHNYRALAVFCRIALMMAKVICSTSQEHSATLVKWHHLGVLLALIQPSLVFTGGVDDEIRIRGVRKTKAV